MKVKELKEKLARLDCESDDLEIFVSPLVEMTAMGRLGGFPNPKPMKTYAPTPFERYKITTVVQAGSVGGGKSLDLHLLFGYDDLINYSSESESDNTAEEVEEFVN